MDLEKILQTEIGLSKRETKIYLALLKLGQTTTGPLSAKSTIASSKVYQSLSSLEEKGLASHVVKGKTKYYQGEEPKKIISMFKERERAIKEAVKELEKKKAELKSKSSVELFEGIKAIKNLLIDLSDSAEKEQWRGFGNVDNISSKEMSDFYEWWGNQKENVKLSNINILSSKNEKIFKERYKKYMNKMKGKFYFSKHYFPHDIAIIKNNVIIMHLTETPIAILIENKEFANNYKKFFDELLVGAKTL